jgi:hypothetical protein
VTCLSPAPNKEASREKVLSDRPFAETAARKLVEIANGVEPVPSSMKVPLR